ncbi:MAG: TRAP transporter small permease [Thermodesulfovibrionales bacterium]|nr:TRAP transporter small permease [Thermodesulfovibrionales bacterium]
MKILNKICEFINKKLLILGSLSILALMTVGTGNVLLRVFEVPYRGAYEIVSFLGALVTAFSLGYTQSQKDHIIVDILSSKYPEKAKKIIDGINYLIMCIFFGAITWYLFSWSLKIKASGELSENLQIIYYPFVMIVALGFGAYTFTLFVDFLNSFLKKE